VDGTDQRQGKEGSITNMEPEPPVRPSFFSPSGSSPEEARLHLKRWGFSDGLIDESAKHIKALTQLYEADLKAGKIVITKESISREDYTLRAHILFQEGHGAIHVFRDGNVAQEVLKEISKKENGDEYSVEECDLII
jgi:hypothetical protein